MDAHAIKGNFVQKFFGDEQSRIINFPSTLQELADLCANGELKVDGKAFPINEKKICGWAYRGFSLQHQSGDSETLSDAEKAERKAARSAKNAAIKSLLAALQAKGMTLADAEALLK
jgi:hypothetical protein